VIFPRDVDRYLRIVEDHGDFAKRTNVAPPLTATHSLESPLLDALDVRAVISDGSQPVPAGYRLLDAGPPLVYARAALGPAVVVPEARGASASAMWRAIARPGWDPARTAAVVGLARPVRGGRGIVHRRSRAADADVWVVDAPRGGLLRVSARYAKGWSARIDGIRVPVLRADGIFRSVVVPPGHHTVRFAYANPAQRRGQRIALLGLLVCAALALAEAVRSRRRPRAVPAVPA
jgi:hypothetical protein